jgi:hypothetical protein
MAKAFVDTTILADATLKSGERQTEALAALARYSETELPGYAIKELKQGVLKNYAWFHNQLADSRSFSKAVAALHKMGITPRRHTAQSAMEALAESVRQFEKKTLRELLEEYGDEATADECLADEYRDFLRYLIFDGWNQRRSTTTRIVYDLSCYKETDPLMRGGQIDLEPMRCDPKPECCMAEMLRQQANDIKLLILALEAAGGGRQISQRKALDRLVSNPPERMRHIDCKSLGDALFALLCPKDSVILTTNVRDHIPLASALGKEVEKP